MPFFPDVNIGDKFQPSALLENQVRRLVNSVNGFSGGPFLPESVARCISTVVYNASGSAIPAGSAVEIVPEKELMDGSFPVQPYSGIYPAAVVGVVVKEVETNEIAECIFAGPVTVAASGSGNYAIPDPANPATFVLGNAGFPVLYSSGGSVAVLLGAVAGSPTYSGPFALSVETDESGKKKVRIASGFASCNGEFFTVPEAELNGTGTVCVCTSLSGGSWTNPVVKITEPDQFSFPVGKVSGTGESPVVESFRVPVAIFIVAKKCEEKSS